MFTMCTQDILYNRPLLSYNNNNNILCMYQNMCITKLEITNSIGNVL